MLHHSATSGLGRVAQRINLNKIFLVSFGVWAIAWALGGDSGQHLTLCPFSYHIIQVGMLLNLIGNITEFNCEHLTNLQFF